MGIDHGLGDILAFLDADDWLEEDALETINTYWDEKLQRHGSGICDRKRGCSEMTGAWRISIIVPVYKVEMYLERCILSIMEQSYTNWELVLIDDGSPDRCPAICDDFAKKDERIKVIHQENGGLSNARNAGMEKMSGDILLFVDSDDWLTDDALEQVIQNWSMDTDMCFFDYYDVYGNKTPVKRKCLKENNVDFSTHPTYTYEWLERAINMVCRDEPYARMLGCVWAVAYSVKQIRQCGIRFPENTALLEDKAFILHCIASFEKILYVSVPIYYYFYNVNSLTFLPYSVNIEKVLAIYNCLCDYVDRIEQKSEEDVKKVCSHYYFVVIIMILWRMATDRNREFKRKGRAFCRERANKIFENGVKDFTMGDMLIIRLCSMNCFVLLEFPIWIKSRWNYLMRVR